MSEATMPGSDATRLQTLPHRFLPASLDGNPEATKQARMFLVSHLAGPVMGNTVPLALALLDPTPHADVLVLALSISLFWVFPFLLRAGLNYHLLVVLSVINLNFCILWSCYHYGGVASPTLTWVLIIPILALFYVGGEKRLHPHLLTVTGAGFATFLLAYMVVPPGPNDLSPTAHLALGTVSIVATLCYVAVMAIYYARVFDAGVDLEREIERRRAMSEELRRAVIAADRASAAKTEFLARMSHELRTPLHTILGHGDRLREDARANADDTLQQDADRILDAGTHLLRLIDTILDLSRLETGGMSLALRPHRLVDLIQAALAPHRTAIAEAGLTLRENVDPDLDWIVVDGARLVQVLDRLLQNACRDTDTGEISVAARMQRSGAENFTITISDTGSGIAPEYLPSLFDALAVDGDATGSGDSGDEFRLAVSSRLCQAMSGSLSARRDPGGGRDVTVTLPVKAPAGIDTPTAPAPAPV